MPLEFVRPWWLLGLIAVLIFSLFDYKTAKKAKQQSLIAPHLSEHLVTSPTQSSAQHFAFPLLAIIACIALAGPSFRSIDMPVYKMEKAQVLVLDLSYSMYATDLKPNRLSQAKYKAIDLIKKWAEGEKALIAYAGDAFTISPLTTDGNAIINHIPALSPDIMPVTGSRADLALQRAITLLKNAGYRQGHIVFFSDGIDNASAKKMLAQLKGTPWVISILGVGSERGAPIKLSDGSLLKNKQGEIVVPKLNTQALHNISRATGGLYLTLNNSNRDIEQLGNYFTAKKAHKDKSERSGKNQFAKDDGYWLAFLLLPLFLLLFRKGAFYVLLLTVTIPLSSPRAEASIWKNNQQNAFQAYQDKNYATASQLYEEPMSKGSALYKNKQYQQALEQFTQAVTEHPNNAQAFYNQGNSYAQLQAFDKAIQSYQQALTINPKLKIAQENKKLIEQLKKQQKKQQKNNKQQKSKQQKQQQSSKQPKQLQSSKQQKQQQATEAKQTNKELEELPNWLKNMPDDPSLLLRNKMRLEYQKRAQSQPAKQQSNGDIW
ncbi:MAG: VWA domain-containing protein [Psychromonas sp.]|nr:VWA domain-containing protein [Psychromonas sp.]